MIIQLLSIFLHCHSLIILSCLFRLLPILMSPRRLSVQQTSRKLIVLVLSFVRAKNLGGWCQPDFFMHLVIRIETLALSKPISIMAKLAKCWSFPKWLSGKLPAKQETPAKKRPGSIPALEKILWSRRWQHSILRVRKSLWTEQPSWLYSMGSQKVRHDLATAQQHKQWDHDDCLGLFFPQTSGPSNAWRKSGLSPG